MAACTLFSDSQTQLVARILNNSLKPKSLQANSLLCMPEPVQCLFSTGGEFDNLSIADSDSLNMSVVLDVRTQNCDEPVGEITFFPGAKLPF